MDLFPDCHHKQLVFQLEERCHVQKLYLQTKKTILHGSKVDPACPQMALGKSLREVRQDGRGLVMLSMVRRSTPAVLPVWDPVIRMKGSVKINRQLIYHHPLLFRKGLVIQERFWARSLPVYLPGFSSSEVVVVFIVVGIVVVVVVEVVVIGLPVVVGWPPQQPKVNEYSLVK
jgi:hypothetical protein